MSHQKEAFEYAVRSLKLPGFKTTAIEMERKGFFDREKNCDSKEYDEVIKRSIKKTEELFVYNIVNVLKRVMFAHDIAQTTENIRFAFAIADVEIMTDLQENGSMESFGAVHVGIRNLSYIIEKLKLYEEVKRVV